MKWGILLVVACGVMLAGLAFAVTVNEGNDTIVIEAAKYKVEWKKAAQMGYIRAYAAGSSDSIIGSDNSRNLYHSSNYGGWKDWGALQSWEVVEEGGGQAVVKYVSQDAGAKQYTCVATYRDSTNIIQHDVTVTNVGADPITSFQSSHDPMFEPRRSVDGMEEFDAPISHAAYWTPEGFAALYAYEDGAVAGVAAGWNGQGRMFLNHDAVGKELQQNESHTITFFVAFGAGGLDEANALTSQATAVEPNAKLAVTWGSLKR